MLSLLFFCLFFDQMTKRIFFSSGNMKFLQLGSIDLSVHPVWNSGVSFSFLSGLNPVYLSLISGFITAYFIYLLKNAKKKWEKVSLNLIIGGALGNLIDRIFFGKVFDFMLFKWKNYFFPVFNFADIAITFGGAILFLSVFFLEKKSANKKIKGVKDE